MKIAFILPGLKFPVSHKSNIVTFVNKLLFSVPPTFGILAALTPQRHSITFMDDRIQNIDFDESYESYRANGIQ